MALAFLAVAYIVTMCAVVGAFIYFRNKKNSVPEVEGGGVVEGRGAGEGARGGGGRRGPARGAAGGARGNARENVQPAPAAARGPPARGGDRNQGALERMRRLHAQQAQREQQQQQQQQQRQQEDPDEGVDEGDGEQMPRDPKAEKKAMKLTREQRKQMEQEAEEGRKKKGDAYKEKLAKRQEEREAKEKEKKEEELRLLEAERKDQEEEFEEWKDLITTENAGTGDQDAAEESQGLLGEFIAYIKDSKVVSLEDLARKFELRTQDVVSRIKSLEDSDMLTGVLDDRGKYIYISAEEMDQVAAYVRQRGRVSIADIVAESNRLIQLSPSPGPAKAELEPLPEPDQQPDQQPEPDSRVSVSEPSGAL